jgi:hypothetical protein
VLYKLPARKCNSIVRQVYELFPRKERTLTVCYDESGQRGSGIIAVRVLDPDLAAFWSRVLLRILPQPN